MDRKYDVLVVEDDAALNRLFCQFVELAGHSVHYALDGGSALLAADEHPPALVLLDLMLPDLTGYEVCKELKRSDRTSTVTVVMVTAMGDEESRRRNGMRGDGVSGQAGSPRSADRNDQEVRTLKYH